MNSVSMSQVWSGWIQFKLNGDLNSEIQDWKVILSHLSLTLIWVKLVFDLFLFSSPCWKSSLSSSVPSSRGFMKAAPLFSGSLATSTNRASVILTHWPSISCSRWSVDSADDLPTHVTWPEKIFYDNSKNNNNKIDKIIIMMIIFIIFRNIFTWHSYVTVRSNLSCEVNLVHKTCDNGPRTGLWVSWL